MGLSEGGPYVLEAVLCLHDMLYVFLGIKCTTSASSAESLAVVASCSNFQGMFAYMFYAAWYVLGAVPDLCHMLFRETQNIGTSCGTPRRAFPSSQLSPGSATPKSFPFSAIPEIVQIGYKTFQIRKLERNADRIRTEARPGLRLCVGVGNSMPEICK